MSLLSNMLSAEFGPIFGGVDGIVGFVAFFREAGVFLHDDGFVFGVAVVTFGVEVPEFVDAGVGVFGIVVVHDWGALEVTGGEHFGFKVKGAPAEVSGRVFEISVEWTGVHYGRFGASGA